jgi:hypothetical protein
LATLPTTLPDGDGSLTDISDMSGLDFPGPPVCRPGRPEPPPVVSGNRKGRTFPPDPLQVCGHRLLSLYRLAKLSRFAACIKPLHQVFAIPAEGYGERRASPSLKETCEARRAERVCCCLTASGGIRFSRCKAFRSLWGLEIAG